MKFKERPQTTIDKKNKRIYNSKEINVPREGRKNVFKKIRNARI